MASLREMLEPGAFNEPDREGLQYEDVRHSEVENSVAISLKRIADALDRIGEGEAFAGFRNQLLDIAYQAGLNFRGRP